MKRTILLVSILMLGILTVPTASAVEGPVEPCRPASHDDGALVGTAACGASWGGPLVADVCDLIFGGNCR